MQDLLRRPTPTIYELALVIPLAFIVTIGFTIVDINIHDNYVLPDIVASFGSPDQLAVGDLYWATLNGMFLFVGGIMVFLRIILGKLAGARWSSMLIFVALLWGFSTVGLFYFGWLDFFYYYLQGEQVPETLAWLNNAGLFIYVKGFGDDPNNVEQGDLYLLMSTGFILIVGLWFWMHYHHTKRHFRKVGIR